MSPWRSNNLYNDKKVGDQIVSIIWYLKFNVKASKSGPSLGRSPFSLASPFTCSLQEFLIPSLPNLDSFMYVVRLFAESFIAAWISCPQLTFLVKAWNLPTT